MEITWNGQACFKIKGKTVTVVTDPYNPEYASLKLPSLEADIVTVSHSHQDHNFVEGIKGEPFVVKGPGEYEIKGVSVVGVSSFHDDKNGAERGNNILFNIEIDGINIAHLGDLGQTLTNEQLEELGSVDILLVPVGGVYTIEADVAAKLTSAIEPKIVIPMHYKIEGLKFPLDPVEKFLKEMGKENVQSLPKLLVRDDRLPEELQVVLLEPAALKS